MENWVNLGTNLSLVTLHFQDCQTATGSMAKTDETTDQAGDTLR